MIHNAVRTFTLDTRPLCCENHKSPPVANFACYVCVHSLPGWSFFIFAVFLNILNPKYHSLPASTISDNLFSLFWKIAMGGLFLFSQRILQLLNLEELPLKKRQNLIYMHDGALAHWTNVVTKYLNAKFSGRWIGYNSPYRLWAARAPDLTPTDFSM